MANVNVSNLPDEAHRAIRRSRRPPLCLGGRHQPGQPRALSPQYDRAGLYPAPTSYRKRRIAQRASLQNTHA